MLRVFLVLSVLSLSCARPNDDNKVPHNVITVPPNCPEGQAWIDGQCRDIWIRGSTTPVPSLLNNDDAQKPKNVVTVPPNCAPGQQLINGVCRDIWRLGALADSKVFQNLIENLSALLSEFSQHKENAVVVDDGTAIEDRNIISVPNQCPSGYKPDALGICRRVL